MRAARVTVLRFIPEKYITAIVMTVHTGTPELAIIAERNGKSISITKITTSIEMTKSLMKDQTDLLTTFGWSQILVIVTLSGSSPANSSRILSTSFPNAVMSWSGRISREMTRAVCPL